MLKSGAIDPRALANDLGERWSPRVIGALDDYYVKVAKVCGELVWHSHEEQDELFFVLQGRLHLHLPDGDVELGPGALVGRCGERYPGQSCGETQRKDDCDPRERGQAAPGRHGGGSMERGK